MPDKARYPLFFCTVAVLAAACSGSKETPETRAPGQAAKKEAGPESMIQELQAGDEVAVIATDFGRIVLRFYPEVAPNHVKNFKSLARSKFYDGTTFHRVIPGFMIQGGDPNSRDDDPANDGAGDGPRRLRAEFSRLHHTRGAVSMARSEDPHSASCQFFICVGDAPWLDRQYSQFGRVVEGMETADKIVDLPRSERDNPGKAAVIRSITIERAGDVLELPLS